MRRPSSPTDTAMFPPIPKSTWTLPATFWALISTLLMSWGCACAWSGPTRHKNPTKRLFRMLTLLQLLYRSRGLLVERQRHKRVPGRFRRGGSGDRQGSTIGPSLFRKRKQNDKQRYQAQRGDDGYHDEDFP